MSSVAGSVLAILWDRFFPSVERDESFYETILARFDKNDGYVYALFDFLIFDGAKRNFIVSVKSKVRHWKFYPRSSFLWKKIPNILQIFSVLKRNWKFFGEDSSVFAAMRERNHENRIRCFGVHRPCNLEYPMINRSLKFPYMQHH